MNTISLKKLFSSTLVLTVFALTACNNITMRENTEASVSYLKITDCSIMRSVLPVYELVDMTNFVLIGKKTAYDNSQQIAEFETYSELLKATIPIEHGTWDSLTLTAYEELTVFSASVCNFTIEDGMNTISFELVPDTTKATLGVISVTFAMPDTVKGVRAGLFALESDNQIYEYDIETLTVEQTENETSAVYEKYINSGTYRLKVWFYADETQTAIVSTHKELVTVVAGNTSEAKITISELNDIYTINYDLDGGCGYDLPSIYTRYSGVVLPGITSMEKQGYFFDGWYTANDGTGERVYWIDPWQEEDVMLYAKWVRGCAVYASTFSSVWLSDSSYGDTYTIRLLGEWTNSELSSFGSKLSNVSSSKHIMLDMSEVTGITKLGSCFQNCTASISVLLPNSLEVIDSFAFRRCSGLISIEIPDSVTDIGWYAFDECTNLAKVTIGSRVKSIGYWAFSDCHSLTSINLPGSVKDIGQYAFSSCYSLDTITFTGTVEQWNAISFSAYWHWSSPATKVICINGEVVF